MEIIVAFGLKFVRDFWGGGIYIISKHLYLNDYSEFDSKISYIMFYMIIS